jgi:tripartite-type tricarboxylate transporter receptor subunit TctC
MLLPRRRFLHLAAGFAATATAPRTVYAQAYPARPVRIVAPVPPGGTADMAARIMAQWLSERLGQPFVIENKPGAATNIGTEAVVRSAPDGYTLLATTGNNATNASIYDKLSFNFIRDITPISRTIIVPMVMEVNPSVPAKTVAEFIAHAKGNPGRINMASSGIGSPAHVAAELFGMMTGVKFTHVPYRGDAPALTALIGGEVQVYFGFLPASVGQIRSGTVRALGVTTGERSAALPDIPTVGETVAGYEAASWNGIAAPSGTPEHVIDKLNAEVNAGLADPAVRARFAADGAIVRGSTPAEFRRIVAEDTEKWAKVVRFAGIKAD